MHASNSHKFCQSFKDLFRRKYKKYRYKIFKLKKDISTVVTQNGRLLLAHSTANVWASHQSIYGSWSGEFYSTPLQSHPSVSWDFDASRCKHIPPGPAKIYISMDWGLGWRWASHLLRWNLGHTLATIFAFSLLCEWVQNPAGSTTHLRPQIQFPPEMVWHRFNLAR